MTTINNTNLDNINTNLHISKNKAENLLHVILYYIINLNTEKQKLLAHIFYCFFRQDLVLCLQVSLEKSTRPSEINLVLTQFSYKHEFSWISQVLTFCFFTFMFFKIYLKPILATYLTHRSLFLWHIIYLDISQFSHI